MISPAEFVQRQRVIMEAMEGHEAHRAFDALCCEALRSHGYDPSPFEASVQQWHNDAKPYPYWASGERNGLAKLNPDKVREIRRSQEPPKVLAERFGVSKATIGFVRQRKTWRHVV